MEHSLVGVKSSFSIKVKEELIDGFVSESKMQSELEYVNCSNLEKMSTLSENTIMDNNISEREETKDPLDINKAISTNIKEEPITYRHEHEIKLETKTYELADFKLLNVEVKIEDVDTKEFTETNIYDSNNQTKCTESKKFICTMCSKEFTTSSSLKSHKRLHTGDKPFKCVICFKTFNQSSGLRTHERIHTGERPFKCTTCSKSFSDASTLKKHERIHTNERPFECPICFKTFNRPETLKAHKRIHTGEKPYKCSTCLKTFTHLPTLKAHGRIHTSEKPYKCCTCFKAFNGLAPLRRHERIHTGKKPYKCGFCFKTFDWPAKLKSHEIRIHTGEKQ